MHDAMVIGFRALWPMAGTAATVSGRSVPAIVGDDVTSNSVDVGGYRSDGTVRVVCVEADLTQSVTGGVAQLIVDVGDRITVGGREVRVLTLRRAGGLVELECVDAV